MLQNAVALMVRIVTRNWLTLFGASLTTVSGIGIVAFLVFGLLGLSLSPYVAILGALILPGMFVIGLLLIPVGSWWENKRRTAGRPRLLDRDKGPYPSVDFNKPRVRRAAAVLGIFTVVNLLILSTASYEGLHYMDSPEFCGQVCHTVMAPEHTAYIGSPHARVNCVDCHIGPGAPWFVRSKLSGLGQVWAVTLGSYETPIPTPVENLRPSQDTCEQCHWPAKFTGDRIKVIRKFSPDEANTPLVTALLIHIGGGESASGGIHSWHIDPGKVTTYVSFDGRQTIPWVSVSEADGTVTEYKVGGLALTPERLAAGERRVMDCIDCHNRPTHVLKSPDRALDEAIAAGRIDRKIPFIKKATLDALVEVGGAFGPAEQVGDKIRAYYRENWAQIFDTARQGIEQAAVEAESIYRGNVFPAMKVGWGTYPVNIGHEAGPGCFRCHDGDHQSADGRSIEQDCTLCHQVLAWDEEDPQVLKDLGID